jgi:adenosylcobinamide-GDP ribazoletransferase
VPLVFLPPARANGVGRAATLSRAEARAGWVAAMVFAATPVLAGVSLGACLLALLLAGLAVRTLCAFADRMIGGQTGDVAGAAQQAAEITMLAAYSAVLA